MTISMVVSNSLFTTPNRSRISEAVLSSNSPVGSSANNSLGLFDNATAMATLCCSPPESLSGVCLARSDKPTRSRSSEALLSLLSSASFVSIIGNVMFSMAVK